MGTPPLQNFIDQQRRRSDIFPPSDENKRPGQN
jgi:hypothetical protein